MSVVQLIVYQILSAILLGWLIWKICLFVRKYRQWTQTNSKVTSFGKRHPIFGHMHFFHDEASYLEAAQKLIEKTKCKLYGGWFFFAWPAYAVCHPDTFKVLLKSTAPKPKGFGGSYSHLLPWLGDGLLLSDGPKWERNRRLLTPAFHFNVLIPYMEIYNKTSSVFLDKMCKERAKGHSVEIYQPIALATLDVMLRCAFSYDSKVQEDDKHPYAIAVKELTHIVTVKTMTPLWFFDTIFYRTKAGRKQKQLTKYVHDFTDGIISTRKNTLKERTENGEKKLLDFIDILLTAKDENGEGLTDHDIRAEADTFLFEGHDTTASALNWAVCALGLYQSEQEKVLTEVIDAVGEREEIVWEDLPKLRYLGLFIKEVLRMYSPVPLVSRTLNEPLELDGVLLPERTSVDVNIVGLHHHPDIYPDHKSFRPDRFSEENSRGRDPYAFVPFSAGSRNCIGQNFAMNEMKVFLARMVKRFKITLDPDHKVELMPETVMRAKYGIKIFLEDR